jgi:hypothetical protein
MRCEEMSERIPEWLSGELDERGLHELREHFATCSGCAAEATALERLWSELGAGAEIEPPPALGERFRARLAAEIARERRRVVPIASRRGARRSAAAGGRLWRFAAVAATLAVGIFLGTELAERRSAREIAALRGEMRSLHETVTAALSAEGSASERLRGVAYGRPASAADDRIAAALFDALLHDPDVNVRLAALDALAPRAARPDERPRWVAAVARQDSPLVQLSLLDVLLASGSPEAERDLAQLLDNPDLDPVARGYLRDRLGRSL